MIWILLCLLGLVMEVSYAYGPKPHVWGAVYVVESLLVFICIPHWISVRMLLYKLPAGRSLYGVEVL